MSRRDDIEEEWRETNIWGQNAQEIKFKEKNKRTEKKPGTSPTSRVSAQISGSDLAPSCKAESWNLIHKNIDFIS